MSAPAEPGQAPHSLAAGQRVRVWGNRTAVVRDPHFLRRRKGESAVLVLLDPFVADWHDHGPTRVATLELICAPEDLEEL